VVSFFIVGVEVEVSSMMFRVGLQVIVAILIGQFDAELMMSLVNGDAGEFVFGGAYAVYVYAGCYGGVRMSVRVFGDDFSLVGFGRDMDRSLLLVELVVSVSLVELVMVGVLVRADL
jgi:hypothetical protein